MEQKKTSTGDLKSYAKQHQHALEYLLKWIVFAFILAFPMALSVFVLTRGVELLLKQLEMKTSYWIYFWPTVGALFLGLVLRLLDADVKEEGVPAYVKSILRHRGFMPGKIWPLKILATLVTVGFGGSGGLIGPMSQSGGALGSYLGRIFRRFPYLLPFREDDLRIAGICGAAAAFGALLKAPIAGGFLAVEILYAANMSYRDLFPAFLASASCYVIYCSWTCFDPLFQVARFDLSTDIIIYSLIVGVSGGIIGAIFIQTLRYIRKGFHRSRFPLILKPAVGGLLVGLTAYLINTDVMGYGREVFVLGSNGGEGLALSFVVLLLIGKLVATCFTVGSGGSGGVTFPMIVAGALMGAVGSKVFHITDPGQQMALSVTGICSLMGAVLNVPIAAIIFSIEVFHTQFALPAIIGAVVGFQIARPHVVFEYLDED